jgi:hypothetical protein
MTRELNLQSLFNDLCNDIDKIVGKYVTAYQPRISKHELRDGYLISLTAKCKICGNFVMASISTTEDRWAHTLARFFIQRAEFHAKSEHRILTEFKFVPKTPLSRRTH